MQTELTYRFYQHLESDNLSFLYQGYFSDEITDKVVSLSESYLTTSTFAKVRKKVSFLMVECFQNIIRHGDNSAGEVEVYGQGFFLTRNIGNIHYITTANVIENENVLPLKEKLQQVNGLDRDSLSNLYFDVLSNQSLSQKGGAGLGLIEMARKSGQKLDFDFVPLTEKYSYFYLQLKLCRTECIEENEKVIPLQTAQEFHEWIDAENIFLVQKGNFVQDAIKPILSMAERNIKQQVQKGSQKIAFHVLVEILQNISRHAYPNNGRKEGLFIMGEKNHQYNISTGNFIANTKIEGLRKQLEELNMLSREELNLLYKKMLRSEKNPSDTHTGLGLISVARECTEKLIFGFRPIDEQKSFFVLTVKI